jgi:exopolysaccharide biosynthesis polyprenyl glycosylphosphotransferase
VNGFTLNGSAVNGSALNGSAVNGSALNGSAAPPTQVAHEPRHSATRLRPAQRDFLIDVTALGLAVVTAAVTADLAAVPTEVSSLAGFAVITLALLAARGLYSVRTGIHLLDVARTVIAATATAAMTVVFARVLLGAESEAASQAVREWFFATVFLIGGRAAVRRSEAKLCANGQGGRRTLIVGAGRVGHVLARRLLTHRQIGLRLVGFVDDHPLEGESTSGSPVLGPISRLEQLVQANAIEHAILSFSMASHDEELEVSRTLQRLGVSVSVVPRLFEDIPDRMRIERVAGLPLLSIYPSQPRGWQFRVKYALDRVLATAALLVAAPVMLPAALGVLITMGRPILFRQRRVGLDGREFQMLKFRTMYPPAERAERSMAEIEEALMNGLGPGGIEGEDRRSRFGSLLRRTSIDELPQLVNVLRGEMSLVGPRPERDNIAAKLERTVYRYADRARVKSGITGWAQVHGLRGRTSLSDRVEWDNYYIDNWSLWLDLKIVLMTVVALLRDRFD